MVSNEPSENNFLESAVKFRVLTSAQAAEIRGWMVESGGDAKEIAIRRGFVDGQKLDILDALEFPTGVAPGYCVQSVLGSGGFGVVFKAVQLNLERVVALKTIRLAQLKDKATKQRFEREAKIVGQLRHPNIIAAFDFGLHHDRLFLSMEYVQGLDAERSVERNGPMDEYTVWQIVRQVSMALAYAAEHGVIHRDIKPGNLMLTEAPVGYSLPDKVPMVKVADFGLACFNANHLLSSRITMADSAVGTPFYMAPEQLTEEDVDQRADIYSLGVTAWQMLTGQPPMSEMPAMSIIARKINGDSSWLDSPPNHLSEASVELIRRMCAHDRTSRVENHPRLLKRIDQALALFESTASEAGAGGPDPGPSTMSQDFDLHDSSEGASGGGPLPVHLETTEFSRSTLNDASDLNAKWELGKAGVPPLKNSPERFVSARRILKAGGIAALLLAAVCWGIWAAGGVDRGSWFAGVFLYPGEVELAEFTSTLFLFNGEDTGLEHPQNGNWEVDAGKEKGVVLAGYGMRTYRCVNLDSTPIKYFRVQCGFLHHESENIEIRVVTEKNGEIGRVEIDRHQAVFFAVSGKRSYEVGRRKLQTYNTASQGYHEIVLGRHVNFLTTSLDDKSLGRVHSSDVSAASVELFVDGFQNAHFENVILGEFKEPTVVN
jgi:serine/threonine protein kinase